MSVVRGRVYAHQLEMLPVAWPVLRHGRQERVTSIRAAGQPGQAEDTGHAGGQPGGRSAPDQRRSQLRCGAGCLGESEGERETAESLGRTGSSEVPRGIRTAAADPPASSSPAAARNCARGSAARRAAASPAAWTMPSATNSKTCSPVRQGQSTALVCPHPSDRDDALSTPHLQLEVK